MNSDNKGISWVTPVYVRTWFGMLGGLLFALFVALQIGHSNAKIMVGLLCIFALFAFMIRLGKRVWLIYAFGMNLSMPAPFAFGKSFSIREVLCLMLLAQALFQMGTHRQVFRVVQLRYIFFLLYTGWAALVLALNPIGFAVFGSDVVGGRFYFQLFLITAVFLILSQGEIRKGDAKWFVWLVMSSALLNLAYAIHSYQAVDIPFEGMVGEEDYYSWHQVLAIPSTVLLKFLFARYSLSYFLSLSGWYWVPVLGLSYVVVLLSGKRAAVANSVLYPLLTTFIRRQWIMVILTITFAFFAAILLAYGQGRYYELPLTVQRAISYLPGKWHATADLGVEDPFRRMLREDAMDRIEQNPIIGKGISVDVNSYWADRLIGGQQITGNLAGGSWHTTWLGIAADFGIPAAFFWGFMLMQVTVISYRLFRGFPEGSYLKTMAGYLFITIIALWTNSWTSGHAVLDAFNYWWLLALLFPLQNTMAQMKKEQAALEEARDWE